MRTKVMLCTACALVVGAAPAQAAFPGQNGKIAFVSDRSGNLDIFTSDADGRGAKNLTRGSGGSDDGPSWSPDGRMIVFESTTKGWLNPTGDQEVFVMNADGSGRRQVTFNKLDDGLPAWSPDGSRIVFHRWFGDFDADIVTIWASGWGERNLTKSPGVMDRQAAWSPDGSEIVFSRGGNAEQERGDLYTIRPDGSQLRQLTSTTYDEEFPDWSPDGRRIAFNSDAEAPDSQHDIFVMGRHGGRPDRLTRAGGGHPAFSPDGRRLTFTNNPAGDPEIWTIRADGSELRNVSMSPGSEDFLPDWQPLSRHQRAWDD